MLHVRDTSQHFEVFQIDVFLRQLNAKPARLVIKRPLVFAFQDLFADLTMASIKVIADYRPRVLEVGPALQFEADLVLPIHCD